MPIPIPKASEEMDAFIQRCMADEVMVTEFPNEKQRLAVCAVQWSRKNY